MTYEEALDRKRTLEDIVEACDKRLKQYPRGDLGLTPDTVKFSPQFQQDYKNFNSAMKDLQRYNRDFLKQFSKEYKQTLKTIRALKI